MLSLHAKVHEDHKHLVKQYEKLTLSLEDMGIDEPLREGSATSGHALYLACQPRHALGGVVLHEWCGEVCSGHGWRLDERLST